MPSDCLLLRIHGGCLINHTFEFVLSQTTDVGAAHGTSKAGVGIMRSGVKSPELIWRNLIPIVMAGVNGIYGLITSIILLGAIRSPDNDGNYQYSMYTGAAHLAAGLCCGLSCLGSGMAIGIAGDAAINACGTWDYENRRSVDIVRKKKKKSDDDDELFVSMVQNQMKKKKTNSGDADKLFVSMVLIQVFAGNVALYGLIASILLSQQVFYCGNET